jgi:hypothetical protein
MNTRSCLALALIVSFGSCATNPSAPREAVQAYKDPAFTEFFRRTSGWTAGDGALSIPLSDGSILWLFGDSYVDDLDAATETIPCLFQARNAALLQSKDDLQNARTLIGKGPGFRSWLKLPDGGDEWFWPICGFQNRDRIYVYLSALRKTAGGGMWGFESIGHDYLAKIKFPEMEPIEYCALPNLNGITFGNGFVADEGHTYAFGGKQKGLASDVYVARFPSANPESEWNFWDGKHWDANVTNAVPIARGASTSIHVCKIRNTFVLTTSALSIACDQGREIYMSTSSSPTGPFSARKKIFRIDDTYKGHYPFFYLPSSHPEFINSNNEVLVTYSINGYEPCIRSCVDGKAIPDHYRPRAIRVPLGKLGIK